MKKKGLSAVLIISMLLVAVLTGCSMLNLGGDEGEEKEYKIIFANTLIPSAPIVDGVITLPPDPTSEGYEFGGWFVDKACTIPFDQKYLSTHPITGDIRVYPKWIEIGSNLVIITLNVNGGDELLDNEIEITKGINKAQELPIPIKGGYVFVGWYDAVMNGNQITDASGELVNYTGEDVTLYAIWEKTTYDVTISSFNEDIGIVSGGKNDAEYCEVITVQATTIDEHYIFFGWFDGEELLSTSATYQFEVETNLNLIAKWVGEERVIRFYRHYLDNEDSYVERTFNYGGSLTYLPPRRAGYTFIGWFDNMDCTGDPVCSNGVFENMTFPNNTVFYAGWREGHDHLNYELNTSTNTVKVIGVKEEGVTLIHIPTQYAGYKVTLVGENAFANAQNVSVVIPSSITDIEENAFSNNSTKIYFDVGADLSLISDRNFTKEHEVYTHITLNEQKLNLDAEQLALIDRDYVEANGILADTYINDREEGRAFYAYCWLYTYDKKFTLEIDPSLYEGKDFSDTMKNDVFKDVNLEMGLKSETVKSFYLSTNHESLSPRTISFTFSREKGKELASGYTDGGMLQTQSKGLIQVKEVNNTEPRTFDIDSMPEFIVYNSEQLIFAVEHGYKPIFGKTGTSAEDCYNKAREILNAIIAPSMSDVEKITAIHDYIALNVTYDSALLNKSLESDASSISHYRGFYIEGVFEDKKAVCDGISKAFMLMCRMEGIEVIRVSGSMGSWSNQANALVFVGHAWNKVHVDDTWYTIDVTNDDSIISRSETEHYEVLNHQFFMVSDALINGSQDLTGRKPKYVEDTYKEIPKSTGTYDYHANTTYDGENNLVITSQQELKELISQLKALINPTDVLYTIDVKLINITPESITGVGVNELSNGVYLFSFISENK